MQISVLKDSAQAGASASQAVAKQIRAAIQARKEAFIILATGASQFELFRKLIQQDIDWSNVTAFHLDEYVGLPIEHPASFRGYLTERLVKKVSPLKAFYFVNGENPDPRAECRRLGAIISRVRIDVACVGIGENGHLAFNDPPADFDTSEPFLVVNLDEACRKQQFNEGWFPSLDDVPRAAISMGIRQIMKSRCVVCTVPDLRKAAAVRDALEGPVTNRVPASILQRHADCRMFLDEPAASKMKQSKKL